MASADDEDVRTDAERQHDARREAANEWLREQYPNGEIEIAKGFGIRRNHARRRLYALAIEQARLAKEGGIDLHVPVLVDVLGGLWSEIDALTEHPGYDGPG